MICKFDKINYTVCVSYCRYDIWFTAYDYLTDLKCEILLCLTLARSGHDLFQSFNVLLVSVCQLFLSKVV